MIGPVWHLPSCCLLRRLACLLHFWKLLVSLLVYFVVEWHRVTIFCTRFVCQRGKRPIPVANPVHSTFKIYPDSGHLHLLHSYYYSLSHPLPRNQQSSFVSFLFSYSLITLKAPRSRQSDVCRKKTRSCHYPAIGPSTASHHGVKSKPSGAHGFLKDRW